MTIRQSGAAVKGPIHEQRQDAKTCGIPDDSFGWFVVDVFC
ncbi:MAG: hypothetical protein WA876_14375 [Candidatus Acidiferrales bacterium]